MAALNVRSWPAAVIGFLCSNEPLEFRDCAAKLTIWARFRTHTIGRRRTIGKSDTSTFWCPVLVGKPTAHDLRRRLPVA